MDRSITDPLLKTMTAFLDRISEAQSPYSRDDALALVDLADAVTKAMAANVEVRIGRGAAAEKAQLKETKALERATEHWSRLPLDLQYDVVKACAENSCVGDLQAIVGELPARPEPMFRG